jgi:hypothetical protein
MSRSNTQNFSPLFRFSDSEILCGGPLSFREELARGRAARGAVGLLDRTARGTWWRAQRAL